LTLTWGVAPGYYISRRWRWFADFYSKAVRRHSPDLPGRRRRFGSLRQQRKPDTPLSCEQFAFQL